MTRPTILGLAALLLLAAVFPVAANPARAVQPGQAVIDFFVAQGVEAQYVGADKADVPADVWKKINAIASAEHSLKYDKDAGKAIDCCCCELRSHII